MPISSRPAASRRIALSCGCLLVLVAAAGAVRADPLAMAADAARKTRRELSARWENVKSPAIEKLGGGSANVHRVNAAGDRFIIRLPRRGTEHGQRVNKGLQILATQLGEPELVPASVKGKADFSIGPIPAGTPVQVVEHIGDDFVLYCNATPAMMARVPERTRLVGALVDLLGEYRDRHGQNLAVHASDGGVRLLDPDNSFGAAAERGWAFRSPFFQGGRLTYSTQTLPDDLRSIVEAIANRPLTDLQSIYGLNADETRRLQSHAQRVTAVGLTAAAQEFLSTVAVYENP